MSLTHSKATGIIEASIRLLRHHWALLGAHGIKPENSPDTRLVIDPEALILFTTVIGHFETKLFDEMLDWLKIHGRFINIQRLRSLHRIHALGDGKILAAMATTLQRDSRLAKWKSVQSLGPEKCGLTSLSVRSDGTKGFIFGEASSDSGGIRSHRGRVKVRRRGDAPLTSISAMLLMNLRALLGVNSRAEVLAFLLTGERSYPSEIARRTGYYTRSVLDVLNEMNLSGHVKTDAQKATKEKYFWLRPEDWNFLITWPSPRTFPRWIDWPVLFAFLAQLVGALTTADMLTASPGRASLRAWEIYEDFESQLAQTGLVSFSRTGSHITGEEFLVVLIRELEAMEG